MHLRAWTAVIVGTAMAAVASAAYAAEPQDAQAPTSRVTRLVITQREPLAGGMTFGATGAYEKLIGRAFLELDPADPRNVAIRDKDRAPLNDRGKIEYSTDVYILKPADMGKGNGRIFFEVNNRGNKIALPLLNDTPPGSNNNDPTTPADLGNGFLLRQGYTIAWAGWEGDVTPGANRLIIRLPVATNRGETMTGRVAVQFDVSRHIPAGGATSLPLSGLASFQPYETASLDTSTATLTWRERIDSPEQPIASNQWAFATCRRNATTGAIEDLVPSTRDICYFGGFDPNKLYQLVYTAKNPKPMALGYSATRDVLSFLRYAAADDEGTPNPLGTGIANTICMGISSSGMYVRDFVYLGFNEDSAGRRVCDGLMVHIPGAFRLHLSTRFTQPDIYSRQDLWAGLWPMVTFPFSYGVTTDPITGRTDGILQRPRTDPLIMQTDTAQEYWQFNAALVTHDANGRPLTLPDTVRYYLLASTQHFPTAGAPPARGICEQLSNPNHPGVFMRALLVAMDDWVTNGTPPPASEYPRTDNGTLVAPDRASTGFPMIPNVSYSGLMHRLALRDYGPGFTSRGGVITQMPPSVVGPEYAALVPKVDADGNDVAGLRRPDTIMTPLGTYTGWNHRRPGSRGGDLCSLTGSFIPFAQSRAERDASGDPRPSVAERYPTHADYVGKVAQATMDWRAKRLLLDEDVARILQAAEQRSVP